MATLKDTTRELREMLEERIKLQGGSKKWANPVNAVGTMATGVFSDLSQTFVEKTSGLTNGDINKVWRAKILLDRLGGPVTGRTSGLSLDTADTGKDYIPNKGKMVRGNGDLYKGQPIPSLNNQNHQVVQNPNYTIPRPQEIDGIRFETLPKDTAQTKSVAVSRTQTERKSLHDQSFNHKRNEIIIFNMNGDDDTYQYIVLQNRPPEIEFQGETSWATIKSFGRNVPMYHFTGAEDKINLQISWFCNDSQRPWEVIQKCRLLEAWTKANGYMAGPPVLQLDWGGSGLFDNAYFILTSAQYILKNFRDGYMDRSLKDAKWVDGKLYPMAATQNLVFSRVSSTNPLHSTIYDPTKLEGVSGIGTSKKSEIANKRDNNSSLWQQA